MLERGRKLDSSIASAELRICAGGVLTRFTFARTGGGHTFCPQQKYIHDSHVL